MNRNKSHRPVQKLSDHFTYIALKILSIRYKLIKTKFLYKIDWNGKKKKKDQKSDTYGIWTHAPYGINLAG